MSTRHSIESPLAPAPVGPYSQAIRSGNTLYISGQIPIAQEKGILISGTIEEETKQVMKNIGYILKEANLTYANIVKCSIFLLDMNDFSKVNEIYAGFFSQVPPARETVAVSGLPKGARVEIACIATY